MNTQDWSPLGWTGWISLQSKGLSSLLQHHSSKASVLQCSAFFIVQLSHPFMTTVKTIALARWTFVGKVMSLLLNMLSRLVITFLPRSKRLFMAVVTICSDFGVPKNKVWHCFHCFSIYFPWSELENDKMLLHIVTTSHLSPGTHLMMEKDMNQL